VPFLFRRGMERSGERLQAINGLRGVAALGVFCGHAIPSIVPGGGSGVDILFVLSGFLITGILVRMHDSESGIRLGDFYRRRAFRIWPALLLLLLLLTTIYVFARDGSRLIEVAAAATATMNFARLFGVTSGGSLGHTWALAAVEQFYLVWPLLLAFTPWLKHRQQFVLGMLVVFIVLSIARSLVLMRWTIDDFHSDGILLGCILAIWRPAWLDRTSAAVWPVALALLGLAYLVPAGTNSLPYYWLNLVAAVLAFCLISAAATGRRMPPLELAPLVWLGNRSYGFYLWHFPIIGVVDKTRLPDLLGVPLALALSIAIAALSYRFVELPFLRYGARRPPSLTAAEKAEA
jgi:peptidoglycan/LPS O-acetylase OafA/YrhL